MAKRKGTPTPTAPGPARKGGEGEAAPRQTLARNRRAGYDYEILQRYEAGLALTGTEIKSLRAGRGSIAEAYVRPRAGELWLVGATVPRYEPASRENHDPLRDRKLLLHKREIREIAEAFEQRGLAAIPLQLYLTRGIAKLEIGVGRGRRRYDKRQAIAQRDAQRRMQRALRR